MKEPLAFYKDRKNKYEQERKKLSGKLAVSSILRLLVFLALCAAVYFFYDQVQIMENNRLKFFVLNKAE